MGGVAIDFETANETRVSACAIGVAWIDGGCVGRVVERLIRPHELRFSPFCVQIHGIQPDDVAAMPSFPEVWNDVAPRDPDTVILAHNAAFDVSVLRASLDLYGLPWPDVPFLCTVKIARRVWPDLPNHRLSTVADYLGVELDHHQAGSDAHACARIALAAMAATGVADLHALAAAVGLRPGRIVAAPKPPRRGVG
ncbi:MAG: 3'-5' exonuclease [Azospirillaceae bacterium]|nr:3'-5' exonuclease [Azospirillaceae bacterium]